MTQTDGQLRLPVNDTRATILTHLLGEDLSAIDLEDELDINESAIRRHLDVLEQRGYVEHYFERASRGRPKKLYAITTVGRRLFPQKCHLLLILLAQRIKEKYGDDGLQTLLSGVAADFARRLAPDKSYESGEARLKNFVRSLEGFGFYPSLSKRGRDYYIKYRNCVFKNVSKEFEGQLCKMHRQIVRIVIPDCRVEQKKSFAEGDDFCVHKVILEES